MSGTSPPVPQVGGRKRGQSDNSGEALPHVFPTPKGGIEMEWSRKSKSVILEIDLKKRVGECFLFDNESDDEDAHELALDDAAGWKQLIEIIRRLCPRFECGGYVAVPA